MILKTSGADYQPGRFFIQPKIDNFKIRAKIKNAALNKTKAALLKIVMTFFNQRQEPYSSVPNAHRQH